MMQWLRDLLKPVPKASATVALTAKPVDINSSAEVRAERNKQRINRLVAALAYEGDAGRRASIKAELARRQHSGR